MLVSDSLEGRGMGVYAAGCLMGSDPALQNKIILIGAHYDSLGYKMKDDEKGIYKKRGHLAVKMPPTSIINL